MASADTQPLADGNTAFALDLYARVDPDGGNLFFSPYSISTCLGMVYTGARGETASQMARVLHFDGNAAATANLFGELQAQLNSVREKKLVALDSANGLWAQEGHRFLPEFLDLAINKFAAKLTHVDFRTAAESTRKEINDWVSQTTHEKITDLISPGMLDGSRLVLVNAIYFKGAWAQAFKKSKTADAPFFRSPGEPVQAPLMNLTGNFKYAETNDLQILELPYRGSDVSMVILLPKAGGLGALQKSLQPGPLDGWIGQTRPVEINVFLPRFKLTHQFRLESVLSALGMTDPFSARADFSGMDGARDMLISAVIHKAFVDVNEEGTEAAAATAVVMRGMAVRREPSLTFRADHPFLFLIRENHSGSILFMGRLADPTK
jgi:serpin B